MSSMPGPNAAVRALHAAVSTPTAVLSSLVRRATGGELDQVERIVDGYENEVYRVRTTEQHDVMVRIARFEGSPAKSEGESLAIEKARAVGVPAPEVLLLDTLRIDDGSFPVMVQRTVPGLPLGAVYDTLATQQRQQVLGEIGDLIARLSHLPMDADWVPGTSSGIVTRQGDRDRVVAGGFPPGEFDRMIGLLQEYVGQLHREHSVLCHGDLGPKHVYIDNDRVSGVIDFGDWQAGSPLHDIAVLRVRGPYLDLEPVLQGYAMTSDSPDRRQLDLHTLYTAMPSLAIGVAENDDAGVQRVSTLLRSLLVAL